MENSEKGWADIETVVAFLSENKPNDKTHRGTIFVPRHIHMEVIEHAVKLWNITKSEKFVIAGKQLEDGRSKNKKKIDLYASFALEHGVPEDNLIIENKSTNLLDEIRNGVCLCHERGFFPEEIMLCPFPLLLQRGYASFSKHFPDINVYGNGFEMAPERWFSQSSYIERLLGELDRLREYPKKGDITEIPIPPWVCTSETRIRDMLVEIDESEQKSPNV